MALIIGKNGPSVNTNKDPEAILTAFLPNRPSPMLG
jgi:hypothetical protein